MGSVRDNDGHHCYERTMYWTLNLLLVRLDRESTDRCPPIPHSRQSREEAKMMVRSVFRANSRVSLEPVLHSAVPRPPPASDTPGLAPRSSLSVDAFHIMHDATHLLEGAPAVRDQRLGFRFEAALDQRKACFVLVSRILAGDAPVQRVG